MTRSTAWSTIRQVAIVRAPSLIALGSSRRSRQPFTIHSFSRQVKVRRACPASPNSNSNLARRQIHPQPKSSSSTPGRLTSPSYSQRIALVCSLQEGSLRSLRPSLASLSTQRCSSCTRVTCYRTKLSNAMPSGVATMATITSRLSTRSATLT